MTALTDELRGANIVAAFAAGSNSSRLAETAMPMDGDLETELTHVDGEDVLAVRGEIDMATAPQLEQLCRQFSGTTEHIVLDFSGVTFLDSSGINALLRATRCADAPSITICNPSDQIVRTLRITGVDDLFLATTGAETRSVRPAV